MKVFADSEHEQTSEMWSEWAEQNFPVIQGNNSGIDCPNLPLKNILPFIQAHGLVRTER